MFVWCLKKNEGIWWIRWYMTSLNVSEFNGLEIYFSNKKGRDVVFDRSVYRNDSGFLVLSFWVLDVRFS